MENQKQFSKISQQLESLLTVLGESLHKNRLFIQSKNGVISKDGIPRGINMQRLNRK